ncbi:hypothetical protein RQP46_006242 [Phenoliferia psychrophenolica]
MWKVATATMKHAFNLTNGANDRRSKPEKRMGDTLDARRLARLEDERKREQELAAQATLVGRQRKLAEAQAKMVERTKLMEREVKGERVKTTRFESELDKLSTSNSKLYRTLAAAQSTLADLPSTPFPIATPRPAEAEAIESQQSKLAAGEKNLEGLRASVDDAQAEVSSLEDALAKSLREKKLVDNEKDRLKTTLGDLGESLAEQEERSRKPAKVELVEDAIVTAGTASQETQEEKGVTVDRKREEIERLKARFEEGKEAHGDLAKLRVQLVQTAEKVAEARKSLDVSASPPRGAASTANKLPGSKGGDKVRITTLEARIRHLVDEKENIRSKRRASAVDSTSSYHYSAASVYSTLGTSVDVGDARTDRRRAVEQLAATVVKLNEGLVALREENCEDHL